jgi:hypothetical protein
MNVGYIITVGSTGARLKGVTDSIVLGPVILHLIGICKVKTEPVKVQAGPETKEVGIGIGNVRLECRSGTGFWPYR